MISSFWRKKICLVVCIAYTHVYLYVYSCATRSQLCNQVWARAMLLKQQPTFMLRPGASDCIYHIQITLHSKFERIFLASLSHFDVLLTYVTRIMEFHLSFITVFSFFFACMCVLDFVVNGLKPWQICQVNHMFIAIPSLLFYSALYRHGKYTVFC